jgi:hypothetical protein
MRFLILLRDAWICVTELYNKYEYTCCAAANETSRVKYRECSASPGLPRGLLPHLSFWLSFSLPITLLLFLLMFVLS